MVQDRFYRKLYMAMGLPYIDPLRTKMVPIESSQRDLSIGASFSVNGPLSRKLGADEVNMPKKSFGVWIMARQPTVSLSDLQSLSDTLQSLSDTVGRSLSDPSV